MAQALNRHRITYTRLGALLCAVVVVMGQPLLGNGQLLHESFEWLGEILVCICMLGRLYSTAFLGGHKNHQLITYGPFSLCRNPLYLCSFIGACGIGLMSNHPVLMLLVPGLFWLVFSQVVKREEAFLHQQFGADYAAYCASTPRFMPRMRNYHAPDTVPMQPRFMLRALRDSALWMLALPLVEFTEYLHETGVIAPLLPM